MEHPDGEMVDGLAIEERTGGVMCLKLHGGLGNQGSPGPLTGVSIERIKQRVA